MTVGPRTPSSDAPSAAETLGHSSQVSASDRIRRIVTVTGHVQGVFYRASCASEAGRFGVTGTIVNRSDGRVQGDFEGPRHAVEALIAWCGHGPRHAVVSDVEVVAAAPTGYDAFLIL